MSTPYEIVWNPMSYGCNDWSVVETVAPSITPVTTAETKLYCRIDETADDTEIVYMIKAATKSVEYLIGRSLITRTNALYMSQFPAQYIELPYPPLLTISSISYTDDNGATQTLSSSNYYVDTKGWISRIRPAYGYSWPSARYFDNSIVITYTAGYGPAVTDIPEPIRHSIKALVLHWYENRGKIVTGTIVSDIPNSVEWALTPYRVWNI